MPHEVAVEQLLSIIKPLSDVENVSIANALGRTLATDVVSQVNVPPYHNSAMDGYAFAFDSLTADQPLEMVGTSLAGQPFDGVVQHGQCIRIMTGAKMPADCDTVQMQEKCQANGQMISLELPTKNGSNVRLAGEDISHGQVVFTQGRQLKAADIGVLASLGIAEVNVIRRVRVAVISTGDELTPVGEALAEGAIYESNSYALIAYFKQCQCEVFDFGIIPDDPDAIERAFVEADAKADIVVSSGGVSVGDADYTKAVLDKIGNIAFWKVAIKPGKPFSCGQLTNSYFFGLPGNPVSALVTTDKIVLPALQKLQGQNKAEPLLLSAITTHDIKRGKGRKEYQRATLHKNETGDLLVTATGSQGSGIMTSLAYGECYIVIEAEQGRIEAGSQVNVEMFGPHMC
ncbi:molybdopterin molybdotransferase MoeA [Thalassotalea fusca]